MLLFFIKVVILGLRVNLFNIILLLFNILIYYIDMIYLGLLILLNILL